MYHVDQVLNVSGCDGGIIFEIIKSHSPALVYYKERKRNKHMINLQCDEFH